jgi:transposase
MRYADRLSLYRPLDPVLEQLRVLYGERRRLVEHRAATGVLEHEGRTRSGVTAFTHQLWQRQGTFYTEQIRVIEEEIKRLIDSEEGLRHRYEQLKGIDGVGPVTALVWVCLFYEEKRLDARKISSWLGMAPHAARSGTSLKRRGYSSGHGMRAMRSLLHQCAQSAMRHREHYRTYKERKLAQGKPSLVVANNVANKLIRVICAVWNQDGAYDRNYVSAMAARPG